MHNKTENDLMESQKKLFPDTVFCVLSFLSGKGGVAAS